MLEDNQENVEVTNMTETQYFERECDQKLFEVLSNAKAAPLEDDLKTAKAPTSMPDLSTTTFQGFY